MGQVDRTLHGDPPVGFQPWPRTLLCPVACRDVRSSAGQHDRQLQQISWPLQVRPLATHRVGAENSVTSRDLHVLVDQTTEPVASQRPNNCSGG